MYDHHMIPIYVRVGCLLFAFGDRSHYAKKAVSARRQIIGPSCGVGRKDKRETKTAVNRKNMLYACRSFTTRAPGNNRGDAATKLISTYLPSSWMFLDTHGMHKCRN